MLKYQRWGLCFFIGLMGWLLLRMIIIQTNMSSSILTVVNALPMYLLVVFGAYSLASIGISIISVTDHPEAAREIDEQIKAAKFDLKSKGMKI